MTQDVGGYLFLDESRALLTGGSGMLFDEPLDSVAAEDPAASPCTKAVVHSSHVLPNRTDEKGRSLTA